MDWFRWWHGTVNDPKFQLIARRAKTTTANVLAIWACLLEAASNVTQCDATKQRGDAGAFSCDAYDVLLGIDEGICRSVIAEMEVAGMLIGSVVAAWEKRQPKREDPSAKRTREYRDRKKQLTGPVNVTQCDASATDGDAPEKIREDKSIIKKTFRLSDESAERSGEDRRNESRRKGEDFYLTKKKKKLAGKRLETFLIFWEAFDYKRDKASAADAWLAVPELTERLVADIVAAAKRAARDRPALIAEGRTPKMAEGWLSSRRWEDEETKSPTGPTRNCLECIHHGPEKCPHPYLMKKSKGCDAHENAQ